MSERDEFWASLFPAEDLAELQAAGVKAEAEVLVEANLQATATNPMLAWRTALSAACTEEGVTYAWDPGAEVTTAMAFGHHPIKVPDRVLDGLREAGADPRAVACQLKAVSIDPRFASWDDEEDE